MSQEVGRWLDSQAQYLSSTQSPGMEGRWPPSSPCSGGRRGRRRLWLEDLGPLGSVSLSWSYSRLALCYPNSGERAEHGSLPACPLRRRPWQTFVGGVDKCVWPQPRARAHCSLSPGSLPLKYLVYISSPGIHMSPPSYPPAFLNGPCLFCGQRWALFWLSASSVFPHCPLQHQSSLAYFALFVFFLFLFSLSLKFFIMKKSKPIRK